MLTEVTKKYFMVWKKCSHQSIIQFCFLRFLHLFLKLISTSKIFQSKNKNILHFIMSFQIFLLSQHYFEIIELLIII